MQFCSLKNQESRRKHIFATAPVFPADGKKQQKWEKFFPFPQCPPVLFNSHTGKKWLFQKKFQPGFLWKSPWENSHFYRALPRVILVPCDKHVPAPCCFTDSLAWQMLKSVIFFFFASFTSLAFSGTELQGQTSISTYQSITEITQRSLFPYPPSRAAGGERAAQEFSRYAFLCPLQRSQLYCKKPDICRFYLKKRRKMRGKNPRKVLWCTAPFQVATLHYDVLLSKAGCCCFKNKDKELTEVSGGRSLNSNRSIFAATRRWNFTADFTGTAEARHTRLSVLRDVQVIKKSACPHTQGAFPGQTVKVLIVCLRAPSQGGQFVPVEMGDLQERVTLIFILFLV